LAVAAVRVSTIDKPYKQQQLNVVCLHALQS
jgi:hypothetical protein